jgi:F-type H+-transporting ATPase subunit b
VLFQLAEIGIPWANEFPNSFKGQVVGFILFVALMWKVGKPAIANILNDRATRIGESQEQVEKALSEAKSVYADYAARLSGIEEEQRQRISAAVREAEQVRGEIVAEAQHNATLMQRRVAEEIAREQTRQRILLHRELVQQTMNAAEDSISAFSSDKVQRTLIQDFVSQVSTQEKGA